MKSLFILISSLLLIACGGGGGSRSSETSSNNSGESMFVEQQNEDQNIPGKRYIIAGQSNALACDWDKLDYEYTNIARGGHRILDLIEAFDPEELEGEYDGIIFVHGEADGRSGNHADLYVADVEFYRIMLGDLPLYVSSVGYREEKHDAEMDVIRQAAEMETYINENWYLVYDQAFTFRSSGLLVDHVHFGEQACDEVVESFNNFLKQ